MGILDSMIAMAESSWGNDHRAAVGIAAAKAELAFLREEVDNAQARCARLLIEAEKAPKPPGWQWHHDWQAELLARDGTMCEQHPGVEWPHEDCAGPGVPWMVVGKEAICRELDRPDSNSKCLLGELRRTLETLRDTEHAEANVAGCEGDRNCTCGMIVRNQLIDKACWLVSRASGGADRG